MVDFDGIADAKLDEHLRYGEVFNNGWDAREAGRSRDSNPYNENTRTYTAWDEGWLACDEEIQEEERGNKGKEGRPSQ